jgi:hypothetical protein
MATKMGHLGNRILSNFKFVKYSKNMTDVPHSRAANRLRGLYDSLGIY